MKSLFSMFTDHPSSVDESYSQHFRCATFFAMRLWFAGTVCLVHAIFPFLFEKTASKQVHLLHDLMVSGRRDANARIKDRAWSRES